MNFISIIFLSNVIRFLLSTNESDQIKEVILWEDNMPLTWNDFKGYPDENSEFVAFCEWEIKYKYSYTDNGNKRFSFDVHSNFNKSKSWVKKHEASTKILEHEQLHFDIAELFARRLRKHFIETNFSNNRHDDEIGLIFSNTILECKNMQVQYDKETNHGLKRSKQKEWSITIQSSLKELEEYQHLKSACKSVD